MPRFDGRSNNETREIKITRNYIMHPQGSVLIECGNTKVICTATIDDKVPPFLKGSGEGWITCEYGMLPGSTQSRKARESSRGKVDGRTAEIQRLIGRALRSVVDLKRLGEKTVWIDCDVIQADGGTRTASITGAFVALVDAINKIDEAERFDCYPIKNFVAAVSVGIVGDEVLLDLNYEEDSTANVDMNIIMTDTNQYVEIQGTGEERPFSKDEMAKLLSIAEEGINKLIEIQKESLGDSARRVGEKDDAVNEA